MINHLRDHKRLCTTGSDCMGSPEAVCMCCPDRSSHPNSLSAQHELVACSAALAAHCHRWAVPMIIARRPRGTTDGSHGSLEVELEDLIPALPQLRSYSHFWMRHRKTPQQMHVLKENAFPVVWKITRDFQRVRTHTLKQSQPFQVICLKPLHV